MARFMLETDKMQEVPEIQHPETQQVPVRTDPPAQRRSAPREAQPEPQQQENQYAHMFPAWDLMPPQVIIRRVTRK